MTERDGGGQCGRGAVGSDPLEEVYRVQRSTVMAFLRRRVRSEQDAEDLTHDSFAVDGRGRKVAR